jgi:hypothetical protein
VFGNRELRGIFGARRDEVTGDWRKRHNVGNFLTGCKPVSFSRRTVLCGVSE